MSVSPLARSPTPGDPTVAEGDTLAGSLSDSENDEQETCLNQVRVQREHDAMQHGDSRDPATPRRSLSRHLTPSAILGDCAAVFLPIALLGFVISVWGLDNTEYVPGALDTWRNAITVLATAFPILFASVVGRLISAAAHWKLGRGAEVGLLEILMGSRTVGSTVLTLIQMRIVTFGAVGLLALWVVSPLGAQAFLRMLSTELRLERQAVNVTYFDSNSASRVAWHWFYYDWHKSQADLMARVYSALLLSSSSTKNNPVDLWGNIKIPFLDPEGRIAVNDDWQAIPYGVSDVDYTEERGIPVPDVFVPGNTSFQLESTYIDLTCFNIAIDEDMPTVEPLYTLDSPRPFEERIPGANGTWRGPCTEKNSTDEVKVCEFGEFAWFLALDRFVSMYWQNHTWFTRQFTPAALAREQDLDARETRLLFHIGVYHMEQTVPRETFSTTCQVSQRYVESRVNCTKTADAAGTPPNCAVVDQRLSRLQHPSWHISFLSFPTLFAEIAQRLPTLAGQNGPYKLDLATYYLFNSSSFMEESRDRNGSNINIHEVSEHEFSKRLSQLLNTYVGATQLKMDAALGTFPSDSRNLTYPTHTEWFIEHVTVSRAWVSFCIVACLVLLACGILGVVFTHRASGPKVLGYVSSSVRDSRFFEVPADARGLDGLDMARHIRDTRIRWGVVRPSRGVDSEHLLGIGLEDDVERII